MPELTYLSHSVFQINHESHNVLIDPYLTDNENAPVKPEDLHPDTILLTHGHWDHLGDTVEIAKANKSLVVAVNELAGYVGEKGIDVHAMHIGGAKQFPFGRVKLTIAHHSSSTPDGRYAGDPAGIVLTVGGKTIYHAGDTGLFLDMQLIGELDAIDYMLVPIGDNFTMGIDDAVRAVEFVKPKVAIPMHYDTFPPIKADPEEFASKVRDKGFEARVMSYGEKIAM